ncbi:MAG: peptide ABC transporter substrate-binding protein [Candidatus Cybelea sp.]
MALACAGCSRAGGPARYATPHELRIADQDDPSSLDPLLAHDQATIGFDLLFVQTLVGVDARNRLFPVLINRIPTRANGDISPDGRTIVYHLRRGVRFADGKPLTSADVAFTFAAIVDPRNPVLSEDSYRRVRSLSTPDPYTVVVRLRAPWNAAVRELFAQSDFAFGILPKHAFPGTKLQGAAWEDRAFGTGPFRVTQWRRGDRIVLEPNPYFSPRPKLTRLELDMIPDFNAALVALRSGGIDLARVLPPQASEAASLPGMRTAATPINGVDMLELQNAAAPTGDVRVRRAIAQALDVAQIERLFHGLYPRAATFLPPVFAWHDRDLAPVVHDEAAASANLDAAGWRLERGVRMKNGMPLQVLFVMQSGGDAAVAAVVQRELATVGIDVPIKTFPTTDFNAPAGPIRSGRFNMALVGWIGGADPEQSVVFACAQIHEADNISRFCDHGFEEAFGDQAVTSDPRRRAADFQALQRIVYDRVPVVPLDYLRYFDVMNLRVTGFARNMLGFPVGAERWDAK